MWKLLFFFATTWIVSIIQCTHCIFRSSNSLQVIWSPGALFYRVSQVHQKAWNYGHGTSSSWPSYVPPPFLKWNSREYCSTTNVLATTKPTLFNHNSFGIIRTKGGAHNKTPPLPRKKNSLFASQSFLFATRVMLWMDREARKQESEQLCSNLTK